MPYTASISRINPGGFLFLIDQSGSMRMPFAGQHSQTKMNGAADAINRTIDNIAQRCSQGSEIRNYFDIAILGYTTDMLGKTVLTSTLPGTSLSQPFLDISRVVDNVELEEITVEEKDGEGGTIVLTRKKPVWLKPQARYGTPMKAAMEAATQAVRNWTREHQESYPPIVIHLSDGNSTDGNPEPAVEKLMQLGTEDGPTLIFNVHLSEAPLTPILYPSRESQLPKQDQYSSMMFRISSEMPGTSRRMATLLDIPIEEDSKGYVFNADMTALVQFLDIGTRAASNIH